VVADPHYGKFSNAMSLSAAEIETLAKWADAGAAKGDPKDMPPPVDWVEGWGIGKPDQVYELPVAYDVPASGVIDYQHVIVPTGFTEDKWIQAAEVRPTDRSVVHHIIAYVREPNSQWFRGQKAGVFFTAPQGQDERATGHQRAAQRFPCRVCARGSRRKFFALGQANSYQSRDQTLFLQVHYTPHGHATRDQSRLGIIFAKEPPKERVLTLSATNGTFKIPPGNPNYRVDASFEIGTDVKLSGLASAYARAGKDLSIAWSIHRAKAKRF